MFLDVFGFDLQPVLQKETFAFRAGQSWSVPGMKKLLDANQVEIAATRREKSRSNQPGDGSFLMDLEDFSKLTVTF